LQQQQPRFGAAAASLWNSLSPKGTDRTFLTFNRHIKTAQQRTSYSNTVIGTLAVDGWAVTFGTARRGLGGAAARPGRSSLYQM